LRLSLILSAVVRIVTASLIAFGSSATPLRWFEKLAWVGGRVRLV
jgi:hypothetical protein